MNAVGYNYANNLSQKDSSQLGVWNFGLLKRLARSTACYNSPKQAEKQTSVSSLWTSSLGGNYEDYLKYRF